ncbi:PAAR domain-containing protein [Duganella vulcania]|uniref:PAAR domain-containing protein n=1 Tax=Duganella vulcania TaxID=2692166 RepID=A0A845GNN5_9BURK|nr:PAAR domain-containing protein [Duganella vulcania]MYM94916.1 PAAR domain-containing protein [Duganella vulcania]
MPEIIRKGDRTSHGGTVLEGSPSEICMGQPIAYKGHLVHCPKCRGNFPIVEGVMTTTFFGQGVAVAGMKTSCGATLIATQFTDTVEWGGGGASTGATGSAAAAAKSVTSVKAKDAEAAILASASANYDLFFHVKHDATGNNLSNTPYKITLDDGREFKGVTDKNGHTQKVFSDSPQTAKIEVPYYDNSAAHATIESDPCGC